MHIQLFLCGCHTFALHTAVDINTKAGIVISVWLTSLNALVKHQALDFGNYHVPECAHQTCSSLLTVWVLYVIQQCWLLALIFARVHVRATYSHDATLLKQQLHQLMRENA